MAVPPAPKLVGTVPTTYSLLLEETTTLEAAVPLLVIVNALTTGLALVQTEP